MLGKTTNLIRELSISPRVRGGGGWRCRNISLRRIIKSDRLIFQKTKWNEQTAVFKSSEPPQTLLEESRIILYCSVLPQFKSLVTLSSSFAHLKRSAKRSSSVYNNVVKVGQEGLSSVVTHSGIDAPKALDYFWWWCRHPQPSTNDSLCDCFALLETIKLWFVIFRRLLHFGAWLNYFRI